MDGIRWFSTLASSLASTWALNQSKVLILLLGLLLACNPIRAWSRRTPTGRLSRRPRRWLLGQRKQYRRKGWGRSPGYGRRWWPRRKPLWHVPYIFDKHKPYFGVTNVQNYLVLGVSKHCVGMVSFFLKKKFWWTHVLFWGHWYPVLDFW